MLVFPDELVAVLRKIEGLLGFGVEAQGVLDIFEDGLAALVGGEGLEVPGVMGAYHSHMSAFLVPMRLRRVFWSGVGGSILF